MLVDAGVDTTLAIRVHDSRVAFDDRPLALTTMHFAQEENSRKWGHRGATAQAGGYPPLAVAGEGSSCCFLVVVERCPFRHPSRRGHTNGFNPVDMDYADHGMKY